MRDVDLKHGPRCPRFPSKKKGDMPVSSRTEKVWSSLHLKLDKAIARWAESRVWQSESCRRKREGGEGEREREKRKVRRMKEQGTVVQDERRRSANYG